ncbi:Efflux ABC transporter, ATP-binding protein [hydrothermal vent metagenome]|uniref:Efflux ABC transporter, ATP-binding protein n=1 Tax=hydrothermal vent metagenome TaxID=652676 RepID=A0A3B0YPX6_9ZZZZ
MTIVLEIENLVKQFDKITAVAGVSFSIKSGICFGLLGPNGAGKTTTLEMIEGISRPTAGNIRYKGEAIGERFRHEAGFLFQTTAIQEFLTVKETLKFFESLYTNTVPLQELIDTCSLQDVLQQDNRKLSGGQRQRMLLALALINKPEIVFLDEPTTGLDPQARRNFWDMINAIKNTGKTIILTTHYMEEAELLCDEIAIMDKGKIVEIASTQDMLKTHFDDIIIELPRDEYNRISQPESLVQTKELDKERDLDQGLKSSEKSSGVINTLVLDDKVLIYTVNLHDTLKFLNDSDIDLSHLQVRNRNLEDLFLKLTGNELRG